MKLRLFGTFRAETGDGREIELPSKKGQALLAYLALNAQQPQSRDKLATLLWGDRGDEQARHSLRQCVLTTRKALGEDARAVLESESDRIALDVRSAEIDALSFERLAAGSDRQALEQAADLYAGHLLEDLSVRSEEFDTWLVAARRRLRDRAIDVFARLAELRAEAGETEAAIEAAERLLDLDAAHEATHRLLMRLYAGGGRRAAALRQYQVCKEALHRELDAEPELETLRLYDGMRMQSAEAAAGPDDPDKPAVGQPGISPLRAGAPAPAADPVSATSSDVESVAPARTPLTLLNSIRSAVRGPWRWAAAATLLMVMGSGAWYALGPASEDQPASAVTGAAGRSETAFPLPERPAIVVLPFQNLSDDPEQDGFADGITEAITSALSVMSEMSVATASSAEAYKGGSVEPRQAAEDLGVRYVLDGSVQISGGQVRVAAQLVDALGGQHLWAARFDREGADPFVLQDEITQQIVTALQVEMTEGQQERVSLRHATRNLEAWMLAGNGLKLRRRLARDANINARDLYREAVALDPRYAGAWEGLAWTHFFDARFAWSASPEDSLRRAAELAETALSLDPTRPRIYGLLGYLSVVNGGYEGGTELLEKAVALSPGGADVAALLGLALTYAGEYERGIAQLDRAMRLSPYHPVWYRWSLARAHRLSGRHADALAWLQMPPGEERLSLIHRIELVATYWEMDRTAEARAEAAAILRDNPDFSARRWTRWTPYRDRAVAEREIAVLVGAGLPE